MTERNRNHPYLQKAMQAADIGFWEWDLVTDKVAYSPEWKRQLGYAEGEISNDLEEWKSRLHPEDLPRVMQHDVDFKSGRVPTYKLEFRLLHKDGSWRWIHSSADVIRSKEGKPSRMVGCHIDVTQRKAIEAENARNFRALQIVSESNAALVRAVDKRAYLNEVCRIAVDLGGYRMVWVGKAEQDEQKTVRPVAQAGFEDDYLKSAAISWADCERGRGPVGTAIRIGRPSVIRDTCHNLAFRPWCEEAQKRGYQSCLALPLICDGTVWGALTAYSSEVNAFNDGEFQILQKLAGDLGFGIAALRTRAERERAIEALRESERRLAEAQHVAHIGYWERDLDTGLIQLSEEIYRIFGRDPQQGVISDADLHDLLHPEDRSIQSEAMAQALRGGPRYNVEYRIIRPNGETRFVHCQGDVKRDASGRRHRMFGTIQDITERKQTEEALRQSERKLAAAQRVAHLGHWEYEFHTDRLLWSEETYRIFGQDPLRGALTKAEFKEFVHPEDVNTLLEKVDQAAQGGPPYDFEYRVVRPNGEVRYVHSQGEVKWDRSGRPRCIFGVVQDVTDRRLAEEALRASERRLAEAQRIAHVGHWDYNLQTEAMTWSDEAYRIFGLSPQQPGISTLKEYQEFIHPEDRQGRAEAVRRSISTLTDYDHEHRLIRPNGEIRFIHCRGEVTQDAFGHADHFVGTVQDVTERRQSEEALRESERRLAEAQRIAHVGHWEWDIDTDEILWSDETYRIKGLPPRSIHTLSEMQKILHPEDRPIRNDAVSQALRGGPRYDVEYRVIHPDGEVRFVHSQGDVRWDQAGRPRRMFGTVQDITDRKRAEEQLSLAFQRIELAQQAALASFYEFRPKTDEVIRSDAHMAILGYTLGELKPTKAGWEAVIHPEDLAAFRDTVSNAVRESKAFAFEYRVRHKAGHYLWVSDRARVMRDEAGEVERIVGMIRDITPRRQAEETLREKERLLSDSQRLAHIGGWSLPLNTDRIHWTEETYRIYGVDPDSFVPTTASLLDLLHAEDRPAMQEWTRACMAGEQPDALELRAIRPDGSVRILEGRGDLEYAPDGSPVRIVGTVQDISERKQSEEALRESEHKLAKAQRVAHVGHWERDYNTGQILWSEETYRILGVDPQTGFQTLTDFEALVHPEDRPSQSEAFIQALRGGPRYDVEYRIVRPNGVVRYVHSQCDVKWDETGRPRRTFGTIQDITEQKQAEEALRRSTEIQRRAMEIALVSGFVYEVQSGNVLLSEEAAALFGLPRLMRIEDAWEYVHPDDLAHAQAAWQAGLAGALYNVEYRALIKGQIRWINARAKPETDFEGRVVRIIGVLQDITDRRQLEDQLRQAQKMEAVGQLAAGVAHDFNNLMTVIIGYSYMLLRRLQSDDPLRAPVRESYKAAEQAAALTRQLLAFSRQQVLEPKVLSLGTILADMEEMLRVVVGDGVRVELRSNPAAGFVRVDPAKIQQVLINLAANARDAMPEGGALSLSTDRVVVTEEYAHNRVGLNAGAYSVLVVTDTGKGMDQETLAHIFEPFFTTKEPGRGTGLGMAVVYGIVNQSRGYIDVLSKVGEGTTFKIYFPLVDERGILEMPELGGLASATLPEGKETVLLVEDEEAVRTLAGNVLRASGYTVLEAANGLEAVNLAQTHEGAIDLVVADVVMPYLGGRSLVERLAKLKTGLKVLFISGHEGETVKRHGIREADFPFLEKPFSPFALTQKIREVLDAVPKPQAR